MGFMSRFVGTFESVWQAFKADEPKFVAALVEEIDTLRADLAAIGGQIGARLTELERSAGITPPPAPVAPPAPAPVATGAPAVPAEDEPGMAGSL